MPHDLVLVCAGADAAEARQTGLPLLHLCLGLRENGRLDRLNLTDRQPGCYLGVADLGLARAVPPAVFDQLLSECAGAGAAGLLADFERDTPPVRDFLAALDQAAHEAGLPLFVPVSRADDVEHAFVLADTAVSGGSLSDYFASLCDRYGERVAASLSRVSRDFCLPAPDSEGVPLSDTDRDALRERTGAQVFFSRELCARYFTYMDADGAGHFVLFDAPDTLRAKRGQLEELGVSRFFALWPDAAGLFDGLNPE